MAPRPMDLLSFSIHWYMQCGVPFRGFGESSKKRRMSKDNLKALGQTVPGNLE